MVKKIILTVAAVVAVILVIIFSDEIFAGSTEYSFFAMNTVCTAKVNGKDSEKTAADIEETVKRLDEDILSRKTEGSAVSILNSNLGGKIDSKLYEYFSLLIDVFEKSGGKFDITLGAVSDLWGFGADAAVPDSEALNEKLSHAGSDKIVLSENSIIYGDTFTVDFGAAGKGIALDEIKAELEKSGTRNAVISIGGSVLLYGEKEFKLGIRDPEGNAGRHFAVLNIGQCCVSTSGSYERFFEEDGKAYHHILDPDSGYPAESGVISVTVVSESGILSDALSTACFVLGVEKGTDLAREYGCETVFVDTNRKVYVSDGLKDKIEITDSGYSLSEQ